MGKRSVGVAAVVGLVGFVALTASTGCGTDVQETSASTSQATNDACQDAADKWGSCSKGADQEYNSCMCGCGMDAAKCFIDSVIGAATAQLDAALLLLFNQQYSVLGMGYEVLKLKVCGEGGPSVDTAKDITVTTAKGVLEAMKNKAVHEAEKSLLQKALGALNAAVAAAVCDVKAYKCIYNKEDTLAFPKGCNVKHEEKLSECAPPASCNPSRCTCFDTGGCPLISRCGGGPDTHQTGIVDCETIENGEATTDQGRKIACVSHFNQFWKRCNEDESCPSSADGGTDGSSSCEGKEGCHFEDLPTTECKNGFKHLCHNMSTRCDDGTVCNATKNCVKTDELCD